MHDNWAAVRRQLDHVLDSERALCQARRRQQPSFWQLLRQQWRPVIRLTKRLRSLLTCNASDTTPQY